MRSLENETVSCRAGISCILAGLAVTVVLASCGGGGSGSSPPAGGGAVSGGTGRISGFGSVIVNGIRYDDSSATVILDNNENASAADLRLGMVVDVEGTVSGTSGTATGISARSQVRGPVSEVNLDSGIFRVLRMAISVNEGTVFDGVAGLAGLAPGDRVEVYGYSDNLGRLHATRVEKKSAAEAEVRLTGIATNSVPPSATSFSINGVTIQYNAAAASEIENGLVTNGMLVRVSGILNEEGSAPLDITADKVREVSSPALSREGRTIKLEGAVTSKRSATDFDVNGQRVTVAAGAEVEGTPTMDAIVEVEGTVTGGVLVARKVEIEDDAELEDADASGAIAGLDTVAGTFTMRNGSVTVRWDGSTVFDESLQDGAALANGMVVEVEGRIDGNVIHAESIETREGDDS